MSLIAGTRVGAYEVIGLIGAGGMGEVYRARDTKLNRDVAVKVLPSDLAADPERLARFKREAQLLASVNHPNIAQIHGVEDATGVHALILELVDGSTLSERIARGPLLLDDARQIATQIADALAAAHEQGIVHRDLKPTNIKVRGDGTVKVLDFGLGKMLDRDSTALPLQSMSPTLSLHATRAGVILGTAAYMSPEQAKGRTVDRRTDIFAFGCVLYEMWRDGPRSMARRQPKFSLASSSESPTSAACPQTFRLEFTKSCGFVWRRIRGKGGAMPPISESISISRSASRRQ